MTEENISQKFRLKILNEIRKYFNEEVKQIKLISKKQKKKVCKIFSFYKYWMCFYFHFCFFS